MPATATKGAHHRRVVKDKTNREAIYKQSFGDLEDGTLYRDPLGFKTPGSSGTNGVALQKEWGKELRETTVKWDHDLPGANRASVLEKWNELQRKGFNLRQTRDMMAKSLDTGDWQLPLDIITEVFVVKPEQTPAANFIPRRSTQDDVIHATPQTEEPEPVFGLEDSASTDAQGNRVYEEGDPTYADLSYDVDGYGIRTNISDKMILAASNLRSPEATQEEALMLGHRQKTERQIIWGTQATAPAQGDANGWGGFADFGAGASDTGIGTLDPTSATPEDYRETTEQLIDYVEEQGADLGSIAVFGPFDYHRQLRRAFTDQIRYDPGDEIDTGFATFAMEGGNVPVFKTNGIPRFSDYPTGETNDGIFAVNMESVELAQLQEVMVQDLAKLGPQDRFAADQYNVLVSQAGDGSTLTSDHIAIGEIQVPA